MLPTSAFGLALFCDIFRNNSIPNIHGREMMLVRQDPQVSSISSTLEPFSAFFQPFSCHPRIPTRTILVFGEQKDIHNSAPSPIQVPIELPQIVFSTRGLQVGVHTSFVREEPLGLRSLTMIFALCVVEDGSISGHSDFGILSNRGASSIFTWVSADTASAVSPASWSSRNDIHYICGRHLRRKRTL